MTGRRAVSGGSWLVLALAAGLAACTPDYSPNTYNAAAVQQAAKTDQGVVVGVRQVDVKTSGATGAVVGGAAGGIAGAQIGSGTTSAFGALGGSAIGGLLGIGAERAAGDTTAYEYVVRKSNGELVSVTQKGDPPLAIGEHVLVIAGAQARIVRDYTVTLEQPKKETAEKPKVTQQPLQPPPGTAAEAPSSASGTAQPTVPVAGAATPSATDVAKSLPTAGTSGGMPAGTTSTPTDVPTPPVAPVTPSTSSGPVSLVPALLAPQTATTP